MQTTEIVGARKMDKLEETIITNLRAMKDIRDCAADLVDALTAEVSVKELGGDKAYPSYKKQFNRMDEQELQKLMIHLIRSINSAKKLQDRRQG
jgi:hypothetical protein